MLLFFLFMATVFLAYSNGANDNFKGVATLFGSGSVNYKTAIWLATLATFAGSVASIYLADTLVHNFSGKGLVPDIIAGTPEFMLPVAMGAALTVFTATILGLPISTTHSLIGALIGAGLMAVGDQLNISALGNSFFLPLLFSPFIAIALAALIYIAFRYVRLKFGISKETCVCVGSTETVSVLPQPASVLAFETTARVEFKVGETDECIERYSGSFFGIRLQKMVDIAHYFSAAAVSFARGLNDTPKIVALLIVIEALNIKYGMAIVATGMALGGLINAKKVANTLGKKITKLNHGQGFSANIVTSFLVIVASKMGMPVSTTHVSVGSLFGIGLISREGNKSVISTILMSWLLTLPVAIIFTCSFYYLFLSN